MKLLIPHIDTKLILSSEWTFPLHDERINEKFWKSIHGEPKKIRSYVSDYIKDVGYKYSSVPTAECHRIVDNAALPLETKLPAGTILLIETYNIARGHEKSNSITFRILKNKNTPSGRFSVRLADINNNLNFDDSEVKSKYPEGKFTIKIYSRVEYVNNQRQDSETLFQILMWSKDGTNTTCSTTHRVGPNGLDMIENGGAGRYYGNGRKTYTNNFSDMAECLNFAAFKKQFTRTHIDAFVMKWSEKS